jgi:hypothetical protein
MAAPDEVPQERLLSDIRDQYVKYILKIREGCDVSQKATDLVTDGVIQFSDDTLGALKVST